MKTALLPLWAVAVATVLLHSVSLPQNAPRQYVVHGDQFLPLAPTHGVTLPPPVRDDPYAFEVVDTEPQPQSDVQRYLVYPEAAKKRKIEGRVYLRFKVLANGTVGDVLIEKCAHPLLCRAAVDAIKKCRYAPAIQHGKAIACWTSLAVAFRLRNDEN